MSAAQCAGAPASDYRPSHGLCSIRCACGIPSPWPHCKYFFAPMVRTGRIHAARGEAHGPIYREGGALPLRLGTLGAAVPEKVTECTFPTQVEHPCEGSSFGSPLGWPYPKKGSLKTAGGSQHDLEGREGPWEGRVGVVHCLHERNPTGLLHRTRVEVSGGCPDCESVRGLPKASWFP